MVRDWLKILIRFVTIYYLVSYLYKRFQTLIKMKKKLQYIFISLVILTTTTSFGFLESSTIMQGRINREIKVDSVKNATYKLQFSNHPYFIKKEVEKPAGNQITKSIIQSIANLVKNVAQIIVNIVIETGKIILMAIINFFIG